MIEYVYLFTHFIEQLSKSERSGKWQSPNFHKGLYDPLLWGGGSPSQIHWIFLSPSNPLWEARPLSCVEIFSSSCRVFVLVTGHPTKIQSDLFARWTLSGHFYCLNFWTFGNVIFDWVRKIFEFMWFGNFIMRWKGWEIDLLLWGLISLCRRRCAYNIGSNQTFTRHSASKCSKSFDHWPFQCLILLCNAMT